MIDDNLGCLAPISAELPSTGNGSLSGNTFVIKDLFALEGHVPSFGNMRWRDTHEKSSETASVVKNLLRAGASLAGLTKMDQLAYSLVGNVGEGEAPTNPRYPDRFTGGSSSGSASAVAGSLANFGLGTDTAGSIRVPAAACGLFGVRPTHGSVDSDGVIPLAPSFDVVGVLARNGCLLDTVLHAITRIPGDVHRQINQIILPQDVLSGVEEDVAEVVRASAAFFAEELEAVVIDSDFSEFVDPEMANAFARIQGREIWENHAGWVRNNAKFLDGDVRARLENCERWSNDIGDEKRHDNQTRKVYTDALQGLLGDSRLVCLPVLHGAAPLRSSTIDELADFRIKTFRLSAPSSLTGAPQIVIPARSNETGRTLGVSLLGWRGDDRLLTSMISRVLGDREVLAFEH